MEPIKDALNELSKKLEKGELASPHNGDGAGALSPETWRRAVGLRVEEELEALRMQGRQLALRDANAPAPTARDYTRVLFRRKRIFLAAVASVLFTVYLGLQMVTPQYEAHVKMLISGEKQIQSPYYKEIGNYRNVPITLTQSELVDSEPILSRTVRSLELERRPLDYEKSFASPLKRRWLDVGLASLRRKVAALPAKAKDAYLVRLAEDRLRRGIKVAPVRDTNLFDISVKDYSPAGAASIANAISRSYLVFDLEQQLAELSLKYGDKNIAIQQLKDQIAGMEASLTSGSLSDIDAIGPASVKIVEQAQPPLEPAGIPKALVLSAAAAASVLLGLLLALMVEYADQTVKSPQDLEATLNVPCLGSIAKRSLFDKPMIRDARRITPYTQSYQALAENLYVLMHSRHLKFILTASALPGEATGLVIANLGTYFAYKTDYNVLLIDANLREPSLHKLFNISNNIGLADVLEGKLALERSVQDLGSNLTVLPAGRTAQNPITLLDSAEMSDLIKNMQQKYDVVFMDSACLRNCRDASILATYADGVIWAASEGGVRRQVLKRAAAALEQKNAHVVGSVLNNRTYPIPKAIYERV